MGREGAGREQLAGPLASSAVSTKWASSSRRSFGVRAKAGPIVLVGSKADLEAQRQVWDSPYPSPAHLSVWEVPCGTTS